MADETAKPAVTDEAAARAQESDDARAKPSAEKVPSPEASASASTSASASKTDADSETKKNEKDASPDTGGDAATSSTDKKKNKAAAAEKTTRSEPSLTLPPVKREPKIVSGADDASKDAENTKGAPAKAATMFGNLDADQRIRKAAEQNERLLWAGAAAATLIYALLIASQAMNGMLVPLEQLQRQQEMERRGQDGNIVTVEIVPEPDRKSKTTKWQDGSEVPVQQQQPIPPMPPMPQTAALPEPQNEQQETENEAEKEVEKETEKEQPDKEKAEHQNEDVERPEDAPMLLDLDSLVDAAAADLKRQIDRHYDKRPQRRQQAAVSGNMKVRGSGASGKSDPFTDSVIAALMKTRPGPVALWGRVLVTFQIAENGKLLYVRVLQSSGNTAMDQAAVNAIRRARFQRPPAGLTAEQRTYIIDYIFG